VLQDAYVILIMFALQGHEIVGDIKNVVRTAVPLMLYFIGVFVSVLLWSYNKKVKYDNAVTQCFTATSSLLSQ
jgi:ACR3 family arsenite transporter